MKDYKNKKEQKKDFFKWQETKSFLGQMHFWKHLALSSNPLPSPLPHWSAHVLFYQTLLSDTFWLLSLQPLFLPCYLCLGGKIFVKNFTQQEESKFAEYKD